MYKKQHFDALDGMRGVAALSVAFYHVGDSFQLPHLFPRSHLAVDLFFLLSGFVIAASYEPKLKAGMAFSEFMRVRLIRLLPLIWLGIVFGVCREHYLGRPIELMTIVRSLFFIPTDTGITVLFPLNLVEWSLMFEIAINVFHAALIWRISNKVLEAIVGIALVGVIAGGLYYGSLDIGWGFTSWESGISRVVFSYGLGVLFWRLHRAETKTPKVPYLVGLAIIGLAFFIPGGGSSPTLGTIRDTLSVAFLFPLIFLGINPSVKLTGAVAKLSAILGALSYPLYALHVPLFDMAAKLTNANNHSLVVRLTLAIGAVIVVSLMSYAALKVLDEPLRARLLRITKPVARVTQQN